MAPRKTDGKYVCLECAEHFSSKTSKDAHERREHQLGDKLCCGVNGCQESFSDVTGLNRHKRNIHMGKPKSQCPGCKKPFRKDNLKRHMQSCRAAIVGAAVPVEHEQEHENEDEIEHQQLPLPTPMPMLAPPLAQEQMAVRLPSPVFPMQGFECIGSEYEPANFVALQEAYLPSPPRSSDDDEDYEQFKATGRSQVPPMPQEVVPVDPALSGSSETLPPLNFSRCQFLDEDLDMSFL